MEMPAAFPSLRDRPGTRLYALAALGCLLALAMGALATSSHGLVVASAGVTVALGAIVVALYVRDPVLALICLWLFEIFNAPLSATFGYFSSTGEAIRQGNELLVLLFVALTIWRTLRTGVRVPALRFLLPGIGVAVFGVLGDIVHSVPLSVSAVGTWLGLKFWVMVVVTLLLPWEPGDLRRMYSVLTRVGVLVAALGLIDYVTGGAVSRALHTSAYYSLGSTYRAEAVHSILPNPGEYSLFMSLLFAVSLARFAVKRRASDLLLVLLFAGSVMLSLRLKGVLSLAMVVFIVALVQTIENPRNAIVVVLVGALVGGAAYSAEKSVITKQISTYASSESTARSRLYSVGEKIANDNFPLGVGFGRFASYPSRIYYSPVYQQYNLNLVYGLSREYPKFIDDTSWPAVIGETGYGGFAIYVVGLGLLCLSIVRRIRRGAAAGAREWVPLAALCSVGVLLVDALGDPTLFSWLATTTFAMVLGPALIVSRSARARSPQAAIAPRPDYSEGLRAG